MVSFAAGLIFGEIFNLNVAVEVSFCGCCVFPGHRFHYLCALTPFSREHFDNTIERNQRITQAKRILLWNLCYSIRFVVRIQKNHECDVYADTYFNLLGGTVLSPSHE